MIFQEPLTALNPVMRVGRPDRGRPARAARPTSRGSARERALELHAAGRHPRPGAALRRRIPTSSRGHATTGVDRHRARARAAAHPLRRADDRARRDDPGPDPAAAGRRFAASSGQRRLRHLTISPWSRRRASASRSCTPARSSRPGPIDDGLPGAAPSVHAEPSAIGARLSTCVRASAATDPGLAARPRLAAAGLPRSILAVHSCTPDCASGEFPLRPVGGDRATACSHSEECVRGRAREPVIAGG